MTGAVFSLIPLHGEGGSPSAADIAMAFSITLGIMQKRAVN